MQLKPRGPRFTAAAATIGLATNLVIAAGAISQPATSSTTASDAPNLACDTPAQLSADRTVTLRRIPKPELVPTLYPPNALNVAAKVELHCVVTPKAELVGCDVRSEEPSGEGFGKASLDYAKTFTYSPLRNRGEQPLCASYVFTMGWRPATAKSRPVVIFWPMKSQH